MILGISGSGRSNEVTARAVKYLLEATNYPTEFISLSGKKINGCIGCIKCAENNKCIIKDDFQEIADKMLQAEAIVFGVPNYFNLPNGLSHCLWERCYSFRHNSSFLLSGKLGLVISVSGEHSFESDIPGKNIVHLMEHHHMAVLSKSNISGFSQCYTCSFGEQCASGGIMEDFGFIDCLMPEHFPVTFEQQTHKLNILKREGKNLGELLKQRNQLNKN